MLTTSQQLGAYCLTLLVLCCCAQAERARQFAAVAHGKAHAAQGAAAAAEAAEAAAQVDAAEARAEVSATAPSILTRPAQDTCSPAECSCPCCPCADGTRAGGCSGSTALERTTL